MPSSRSFGLALVLLAACSEPEPPTCSVATQAVQMLGNVDGNLCAVTPTGLVLHSRGWTLVLERLSEQGTLEELAQIHTDSWQCGTVAEDPESRTIWLTVPSDSLLGEDVEPPDRLLMLDADGNTLSEETLLHEGAPVYIRSSFARAGELYLAGSVHLADPENYPDVTALLERRDGNGALVWRKVGYAGFNPEADWPEDRSFHQLGPIVGLDGDLAVFASVYGIDSASISMLTINDWGDVIWADLVTSDNYEGPHPRLGTNGDRTIFVSEERQGVYSYDETTYQRLGLVRPARSIVTTHAQYGHTYWRGEVEWPELDAISVTEAISEEASVFHVVSGRDVDDPGLRRVSLARQDWTGAVDCTASLDHLGLWSARSLHQLDDGRLVLGGEVEIPREDDPENPYDDDEVLMQPAIVLLDVESGPAPW